MSQQSLHIFSATASTLILVGVVVAMLLYTFWPSNKAKFERAARLPLENDDDNRPLR